MKKSIISTLLTCELFKDVGENDIIKIAEDYGTIAVSEKNDVIFSETKYTRSIVIVLKGSASVTKDNGKVLMSILKKGDIFGMAAMFYEEENFLTEITALEKVSMLIISKENLKKVFSDYPAVCENYITVLSEKIHFLNRKISTYTKPETVKKIASFILQYSDGNKALLPYSITNVAEAINAGRASVYRSFEQLENDGIIKRDGKTIYILDREGLENL